MKDSYLSVQNNHEGFVVDENNQRYNFTIVDFKSNKWELYQEPIDWDYIIKNKCICWFWDNKGDEKQIGALVGINDNRFYLEAPEDCFNSYTYFRIVRDACGFKYTFKLMRHTGGTAYIETGATTAEAIMFTGHKEERIFNEVYKSPTERMGLNTLNKRLEAEKE